MPYLRNSIAYDHDLWVKRQKMAQDDKKNLSVAVDVSGTINHMIVIYGIYVTLV